MKILHNRPDGWVLIFNMQNLNEFFVLFVIRKKPIVNAANSVEKGFEFRFKFFYLLFYKYWVMVVVSFERAPDTVVWL